MLSHSFHLYFAFVVHYSIRSYLTFICKGYVDNGIDTDVEASVDRKVDNGVEVGVDKGVEGYIKASVDIPLDSCLLDNRTIIFATTRLTAYTQQNRVLIRTRLFNEGIAGACLRGDAQHILSVGQCRYLDYDL